MIVYIKQTDRIKFIHKLFKIFKIEEEKSKTIIYVPMNQNTKEKNKNKIIRKLSKYLLRNSIKNIVVENKLRKDETVLNYFEDNNINVLDGTRLSKFLVYSIIEKIYEYKNKNIQAGEVTLLVNENSNINIENICIIAKNLKRLNIISSNTNKFRRIVEYLYNELGIIIKLTSNMKFNLNSSDVIVNLDFTGEAISKLNIPNNGIIVNIPKNINIKSKKFSGVNISKWEIDIPEEYKLQGFENTSLYEAEILKKPEMKVFEQIQIDEIEIKNLIGKNGIINKKEFA